MSDCIDTRTLSERLEELQGFKETLDTLKGELDELNGELAEIQNNPHDHIDDEIEQKQQEIDEKQDEIDAAELDFGTEEEEELKELEELESEISEFHHGETMIPYDEFEDYCKEMLEDIGELPKNLPHYIVIDWSATASNLQVDYSEVTYKGETYLVRNC